MIVDAGLVRLLESATAQTCADMVEAIRSVGHVDADCRPLDAGVLCAMGRGRYVNRAVGVGLGGTDPVELLDAVEDFFGRLGMPASLEVCPWVPHGLTELLAQRGYVVDVFRDVFVRDLGNLPPRAASEIVEADSPDLARAVAEILGSEYPEGSEDRRNSDEYRVAAHRARGVTELLVLQDGRPIATGSVTVVGEVAAFGGATTSRDQRGRGAQQALLVERLHRAAASGCAVATVTALPDGVSARNIRRVGFQLAYTQAIVTRR